MPPKVPLVKRVREEPDASTSAAPSHGGGAKVEGGGAGATPTTSSCADGKTDQKAPIVRQMASDARIRIIRICDAKGCNDAEFPTLGAFVEHLDSEHDQTLGDYCEFGCGHLSDSTHARSVHYQHCTNRKLLPPAAYIKRSTIVPFSQGKVCGAARDSNQMNLPTAAHSEPAEYCYLCHANGVAPRRYVGPTKASSLLTHLRTHANFTDVRKYACFFGCMTVFESLPDRNKHHKACRLNADATVSAAAVGAGADGSTSSAAAPVPVLTSTRPETCVRCAELGVVTTFEKVGARNAGTYLGEHYASKHQAEDAAANRPKRYGCQFGCVDGSNPKVPLSFVDAKDRLHHHDWICPHRFPADIFRGPQYAPNKCHIEGCGKSYPNRPDESRGLAALRVHMQSAHDDAPIKYVCEYGCTAVVDGVAAPREYANGVARSGHYKRECPFLLKKGAGSVKQE